MTDRADFTAAVRALDAEERVPAGGHPAAEEIAEYVARTLDPERAEAVRAHLVHCSECADLVVDYAEFEPVPAADPAREAAGVAAYARWLRRRGPARHRPDARDDYAPLRDWRSWVLAAATLAAVLLGLWGWSQHRALEATRKAPRVNVAAVDLEPLGSDEIRGETRRRSLDLSSGATLFLALPGWTGDAELRVVVVDERERELWRLSGGRRDPVLGNVSLYLPPGSLAPGHYEIRVIAADEASPSVSFPIDVR